jgi:hypothetical protein
MEETAEVVRTVAELSPLPPLGTNGGYWTGLIKDVGGDVIATEVTAPKPTAGTG